jgi:hypothetical protein
MTIDLFDPWRTRSSLYPRGRAKGELCRFRSRCLGLQPKTGVVLGLLLDLPRLAGTPRIENAAPLLLILRTGGGTGTTLTSGLMRHNVLGFSIGSSRPSLWLC